MPSAQVINFGPDPLTESMGKFASGFSDAFFKKQTQKKNEDIFQRIKESYGKDAEPDRIFKDILEAEGLDQDYKRDLLKEVKEYASLVGKKNLTPYQSQMVDLRKEDLNLKKAKQEGETPITPFQKKNLEIQQERLSLERERLNQAAKKNEKDFPSLISKYTNEVLKNSDQKLSPSDKASVNKRIQLNMQDDGLPIDAALEEALDYVNIKNEIVEEAKITPRPANGTFLNASPDDIKKSMEKAYSELQQLYDAGIESQTDLRKIAKNSGWKSDEITDMLQAVYSSKGRKIRSGKKAVGDIDDILFGE